VAVTGWTAEGRGPRSALHTRIAAESIPGAAVATVVEGVVTVVTAGVTGRAGGQPVGPDTVFDAASLSKPVAACLALQLVDAGLLALDRPLADYRQGDIPPALLASGVTTRHLLTHTAGLPNLRGEQPLRLWFEPGSRFSYASTGFAWLQLVVEAVAGEPLEALAQRRLFGPLGMARTSFEWQPGFEADHAVPHDGHEPLPKHRPAHAQAAWSLQTTAPDYARFLATVLDGRLLAPAMARRWLTPAVRLPRGQAVQLDGPPLPVDPALAWGLGWGIEVASGTFFQWGKMDGVRALALGHAASRSAVVLLAHSNRGLRLMDTAVDPVLPGPHPAFAWLRACVTE